MAEGVGFEPTKVSLAGFQDRCTRPLCEPSVGKLTCKLASAKIYELNLVKSLMIIREVRAIFQSPLQHHLLDGHRFDT